MIVTPDRFACIQYKNELDKFLPTSTSKVVISTATNDDLEFKQKWGLDKDQQEKVVEEFNDPDSSLDFLIVTAKLLTGFDAPTCTYIYLDNELHDHNLFHRDLVVGEDLHEPWIPVA